MWGAFCYLFALHFMFSLCFYIYLWDNIFCFWHKLTKTPSLFELVSGIRVKCSHMFSFFFFMPFKFFRWWVYSILSPASPTCGMYILPARVLQCVFLSLSSPLLLLREFIIVGNWGETFAVSSSLPSNCKLFPAHWFLFFYC